jgi:hypothetical protein
MLTALVLLATAHAVIPPPRMETLVEQPSAAKTEEQPAVAPELQCTTDKRWCMELSRDVDLNTVELHIFDGRKARSADGKASDIWAYPIGDAPKERGFDRESLSLWTQIIREASPDSPQKGEEHGETISIGIISSASTMYSGGGGHADFLNLYRFQHSPYGQPLMAEVLGVPIKSSIMIRACFGEEDFENRRGACHDLYDFDAELTLNPKSLGASPPPLIYTTKAVSTPGNSRRSEDNSSGKKLSAKDILPRVDPTCTYRRVVAYNPVTARYEFDRPGPDCSEYTVP